ncbi:MAG: 5-formyltetrahydrofolate cyclo-ligase [Tannerella sp.]|jgi:5-formyltetrahydrofolate cyclo-ligase|nr:5-formyltetrahydrofolate cyclo-ligase [Tannerella sp.]
MENEKQFIRNEINRLKQSLPYKTAASLSEKICRRLIQTEAFQKAHCIALYYSIPGEVRTIALIEEWYKKKIIVLPVVSGNHMNFYPYTGKEHMITGSLNIPEPKMPETDILETDIPETDIPETKLSGTPPGPGNMPAKLIPAENIDLFIVPGIAFDRECNRLGRGKGFYDTFLSGTNKPAIGLCFGFQLKEHIPAEAHDRKMTMVITEDGYHPGGSA